MTCIEKLIWDHPELSKEEVLIAIRDNCPSGYEIFIDDPDYCIGFDVGNCNKCWHREIPGTEKKESVSMIDGHIDNCTVGTNTADPLCGFEGKLYITDEYAMPCINPPDNVNHPEHYETGKFECIDVMVETQGKQAVLDFCLCNAFKYIYRHQRKNGLEDIKKAKWYIDKYIELCEKE